MRESRLRAAFSLGPTARVVRRDRARDLAVLQLEGPPAGRVPIARAASAPLARGQALFCLLGWRAGQLRTLRVTFQGSAPAPTTC